MNNPFDRGIAASPLNNPFDSDPTNARNRFPDISQTNPTSPGMYQNQQQQQWSQDQYSHFTMAQQQPPQFSPYAQSSPYPTPSFTTGINPYSTPSSPFPNPGFAGGVASGGTYSASGGTPYSQFNPSGYASPSYMNENRNFANPQLAQFDPLNSASGGGYQQQHQQQHQQQPRQQGYSASIPNNSSNLFQLSAGHDEMDPGPITWYPRSPANPRIQVVTAFGGQTTLHIPIRPHTYTANDHPRHIISMHRSELEQWDQYGWRQALNALENLRIAWEGMRDDIARVTDIGCPPHENAITTKMRKEASEKIDNVTAAYLQMQEVFSSYRQSPDPSSKSRVRECLNVGLRNLPEWP